MKKHFEGFFYLSLICMAVSGLYAIQLIGLQILVGLSFTFLALLAFVMFVVILVNPGKGSPLTSRINSLYYISMFFMAFAPMYLFLRLEGYMIMLYCAVPCIFISLALMTARWKLMSGEEESMKRNFNKNILFPIVLLSLLTLFGYLGLTGY